ncbi:MAG TPA: prolyl oligopeptidase family serine peptidase [Allosphingosinicella sp.]
MISFLAPGSTAAAEAPAPIPIESIAQIPFISDPVLSPDGRRILARISLRGQERLTIYDLAAGPDAQPKFVPMGDLSVRWFSWAGNDRVLIGYRAVVLLLGILPMPATRLRSYDSKANTMVEVGGNRGLTGDDVIFTDPDGRFVLLSTQDDATDEPSVERVDLATGKGVEVQRKKKDVWSWYADAEGTVRGGIGYSEKAWTLYYRNPEGEMVRAGTGRYSAEDSAVDSIQLLTGADSGVVVTNGPTGRFGAYSYQLGSASIGAPIFEHPEVDVTAIKLSADGRQVAGISYEDDRQRVKWLIPELEALQAQIDRTFKGKDNRIVNFSRDQNVVLIWSGGADDPGTYYVFDRAAKRMNIFASPYDRLNDVRLSPVRPVRYQSRDGLPIPGYLTLPAGREAKGLPLIVMPHGGPFLRDSYVFDPWVQMLADRGYAVLQPNFRGSTGYGRAFVERGYGEWGGKMQDDLDDGVDWLTASGTIDPKRVCLMGGSYGGYAALWGAIRNPDKYRCAISFAGVSDVRAQLKYSNDFLIAPRYTKQWRKKIVGAEARDLAAVSPLQQAARLNLPVLIAHGERDSTVPVDQSRKMVAALKGRGAAVQSAFYPNAGHGFDRTEDSVDFLRRVEAFLEVHNPAGPSAGGAREARLVAGAIGDSDLPAAEQNKKAKRPVGVRYKVTADGRVTGCAVSKTSGAKALDSLACRLVEERFQYAPARDSNGAYQEVILDHVVTWTIAAGA